MNSNFSDHIWDEYEWESHLNEAQEKSEQLRQYLNRTLGEEGPRWVKLLKEAESEDAALDAFIEEELMFDEAYLPDDDDWYDDDDDLTDDDFFIGFDKNNRNSDQHPSGTDNNEADSSPGTRDFNSLLSDRKLGYGFTDDDDDSDPFGGDDGYPEDYGLSQDDIGSSEDDESIGLDDLNDLEDYLDEDDFDDDFDEGDEWKALSDDYSMSDYGSIERLVVFRKAHAFGAAILSRSAQTPIAELSEEAAEALNQFVSDVLMVNAKVVAGYALGFEIDVLGGNIAFCKKGLAAANRALDTLGVLRKFGVFGDIEYRQLHADLYEVRNDLGIYIQDLRAQFVF